MMRPTLSLLFLALFIAANAQDQMTVMRTAHRDLGRLCSADMHGRGYVNGGDSIAARYLEGRFQDLGLRSFEGSHLQAFSFPVNTFPHELVVKADDKLLTAGVDYLVSPNSGNAQGRFEVMHLPMETMLHGEIDLQQWTGRPDIAFWFDLPETTDRDSLALFQAIMQEFQQLAPVITPVEKLTWSVSQSATLHPTIQLLRGVADEVQVLGLDIRNEFLEAHTAYNVVGSVKGTKKKKDLVVVTAHYDHLGRMGQALFPGANDNASGTSMLLALAQYFAQHPAEKTLVFLLFAGEEAGLVGSRRFVEDPLVDLGRIDRLINLDIMGTGDDGIMVVNASKEPEIYEALVQLNDESDRLAAVKKRGPSCNSDHCPFSERGVPSVFIYTLGGIAHYHNVHDKAETLPLTDFYDIFRTLVELIEQS